MSFAVRYTERAREDLMRLYEYRLEQAVTLEELELAQRTYEAITTAVDGLAANPFLCRKAGTSPFVRELLIPFGSSGYVALFEIEDATHVTIAAIRHQREEDYH